MPQQDNDKFFEGQEVKALHFNPPLNETEFYSVGLNGVQKISIVMENGQMAGVPWFCVWVDDTILSKHNGALIMSVEL
jgi:hypothetical protein